MPHISFSELKSWNQCAFYHKLTYIDRVSIFKGNEYTAFGKSIHEAYEHSTNCLKDGTDHGNLAKRFEEEFLNELLELKEAGHEFKKELVLQLKEQGKLLADLAVPALKEHFEDFEIVKSEESIYEDIKEYEDNEYKFKGFIDLVIKTPDGKYHIIDWKTCSWGWDARKRTDPMLGYQLIFYKKYYAEKHNIDPKNIETYFALVKRTAKKDNVEIFRVTSGNIKTNNAVKLLKKALYNIDSNLYVKNRTSCTKGYGCEFYKTEHCK